MKISGEGVLMKNSKKSQMSKNDKVKMNQVNIKTANKDFEILEDTIAPSLGFNCRHGKWGLWCN